jgi:hypothetical protein
MFTWRDSIDLSKSGNTLFLPSQHFVIYTGMVTCLVNKVNGRLKVKTKVNELPFNAFALVLLLLENEHGVIEELL